jgi:hypothetical protein
VLVLGSKLTGFAMDERSQMPAELNVSFWTQQITIIQFSLSDTDDGFLDGTATRMWIYRVICLLRLDMTCMEFSSTTL